MSFLKPIINSSHWKIYSLCEVCQILWYFDDEVFSGSAYVYKPYTYFDPLSLSPLSPFLCHNRKSNYRTIHNGKIRFQKAGDSFIWFKSAIWTKRKQVLNTITYIHRFKKVHAYLFLNQFCHCEISNLMIFLHLHIAIAMVRQKGNLFIYKTFSKTSLLYCAF